MLTGPIGAAAANPIKNAANNDDLILTSEIKMND
jgi:hypothetical protein